MGVYIKGMEIPKEGRLTLQISANGSVYVVNSCKITAETYMTDAVLVSPHGRLIDADACEDYFYEHLSDLGMAGAMNAINEMPTIIPAEEGE